MIWLSWGSSHLRLFISISIILQQRVRYYHVLDLNPFMHVTRLQSCTLSILMLVVYTVTAFAIFILHDTRWSRNPCSIYDNMAWIVDNFGVHLVGSSKLMINHYLSLSDMNSSCTWDVTTDSSSTGLDNKSTHDHTCWCEGECCKKWFDCDWIYKDIVHFVIAIWQEEELWRINIVVFWFWFILKRWCISYWFDMIHESIWYDKKITGELSWVSEVNWLTVYWMNERW